jgi:hypothetical protein
LIELPILRCYNTRAWLRPFTNDTHSSTQQTHSRDISPANLDVRAQRTAGRRGSRRRVPSRSRPARRPCRPRLYTSGCPSNPPDTVGPSHCCSLPHGEQEGGRTIRLRLITPGTKSLLGVSLLHRNRTYGFLVIGRKENATFREKRKELDGAGQRRHHKSVGSRRPIRYECRAQPALCRTGAGPFVPYSRRDVPGPMSQLTPDLQDKIIAALTDANQYVAYDRSGPATTIRSPATSKSWEWPAI